MSAVTHVTFWAVEDVAGVASRSCTSAWIRACDWVRDQMTTTLCSGDVLFHHARPTCTECAVHLDAALEMAVQP